MLTVVVFITLAAVTSGRAVDVAASGSGVRISSSSDDGAKSFSQWSFGNLTCYIAKETVDGELKVMKQCRNGLLGTYHPMTSEEEQMVEAQIKRAEDEKRIMAEKLKASQIMLQNTMRSMTYQIHRNMQGFQDMMQRTMANAFGMA